MRLTPGNYNISLTKTNQNVSCGLQRVVHEPFTKVVIVVVLTAAAAVGQDRDILIIGSKRVLKSERCNFAVINHL